MKLHTIIKIEKQPTVTDHIEEMTGGDVKRFHLQHIKAVREACGRKMKMDKPHMRYTTVVNAVAGFIEVKAEFKSIGGENEQIQNN